MRTIHQIVREQIADSAALVSHEEITKSSASADSFAPGDLAKLSKVKAKLELIGDYPDMEKVRDVLNELAKKQID